MKLHFKIVDRHFIFLISDMQELLRGNKDERIIYAATRRI